MPLRDEINLSCIKMLGLPNDFKSSTKYVLSCAMRTVQPCGEALQLVRDAKSLHMCKAGHISGLQNYSESVRHELFKPPMQLSALTPK